MKISELTKKIIWSNIMYVAFLLYAFGVFWQKPIVEGEALTYQAVLEPFFFLMFTVVGYLPLSIHIISKSNFSKLIFEKQKVFILGGIMLLILVFGFGIHTAGQIIEESFVNTSIATVHYTEDFPSKVAYFLEEDVSHALIVLPMVILSFILLVLSSTFTETSDKIINKGLLLMLSLFSGIVSALSYAESSYMLPLTVILNISLLIYVLKNKFFALSSKNDFVKYWIYSTIVTIVICILYGFIFGWLVQPTELGFGSK